MCCDSVLTLGQNMLVILCLLRTSTTTYHMLILVLVNFLSNLTFDLSFRDDCEGRFFVGDVRCFSRVQMGHASLGYPWEGKCPMGTVRRPWL